ncbi:MAG TPA: transposase [Opitutaceae bacterium]
MGEAGSIYFITIACDVRGRNQLCRPNIGHALLNSVRYDHDRHDWYVHLFLLMPDHAHALLAAAPDKALATLIGNWKRYATTKYGISWQKNFIDHRLRSDESWEEKAAHIRANPARAGLVRDGESWPYVFEA